MSIHSVNAHLPKNSPRLSSGMTRAGASMPPEDEEENFACGKSLPLATTGAIDELSCLPLRWHVCSWVGDGSQGKPLAFHFNSHEPPIKAPDGKGNDGITPPATGLDRS